MDLTQVYVAISFYILAAGSIVAGALMVFNRDMFRSALWLVVALAGVASTYVLLSADFLAVAQVLIYIGAIIILILFAIMLTPGQVDMPMGRPFQQIGAGGVALALFTVSVYVVLTTPWRLRPEPLDAPTSATLGALLVNTYALPLLVAALLLTVAMIGAIVIAREE